MSETTLHIPLTRGQIRALWEIVSKGRMKTISPWNTLSKAKPDFEGRLGLTLRFADLEHAHKLFSSAAQMCDTKMARSFYTCALLIHQTLPPEPYKDSKHIPVEQANHYFVRDLSTNCWINKQMISDGLRLYEPQSLCVEFILLASCKNGTREERSRGHHPIALVKGQSGRRFWVRVNLMEQVSPLEALAYQAEDD